MKKENNNHTLLTISIILFIGGGFLSINQGNSLYESYNEKIWPTVEGIVTKSEIVGTRAIRPEVEYVYFVNEAKYKAISYLNAPMFGGKRKKYDVARELANQYSTGKIINVYYNPKEPSRSTLAPGASWNVYIRLGFGVILFIVGSCGVILLPWKSKSKV